MLHTGFLFLLQLYVYLYFVFAHSSSDKHHQCECCVAFAVLLAAPGGNEIKEAAQGLWPQLFDPCLFTADAAHPKMHGYWHRQWEQQRQRQRQRRRGLRLSHAACAERAEGGAADRRPQRLALEYSQVPQESAEGLSLWQRFARTGALVLERLEPYGSASSQRGHGLRTVLVRLRALLLTTSGCSAANVRTDRFDTAPGTALSASHGTGHQRCGHRANPSHGQNSQPDWRRGWPCDRHQSERSAHVLSTGRPISYTHSHLQHTLVSQAATAISLADY